MVGLNIGKDIRSFTFCSPSLNYARLTRLWSGSSGTVAFPEWTPIQTRVAGYAVQTASDVGTGIGAVSACFHTATKTGTSATVKFNTHTGSGGRDSLAGTVELEAQSEEWNWIRDNIRQCIKY